MGFGKPLKYAGASRGQARAFPLSSFLTATWAAEMSKFELLFEFEAPSQMRPPLTLLLSEPLDSHCLLIYWIRWVNDMNQLPEFPKSKFSILSLLSIFDAGKHLLGRWSPVLLCIVTGHTYYPRRQRIVFLWFCESCRAFFSDHFSVHIHIPQNGTAQ